MYLYNHKDILVIYQLLESFPLPPASKSTTLILLQALDIIQHKEEGNMGPCLDFCNESFRMSPSEGILFPSKILLDFIAVCLCILPSNHVNNIHIGKMTLKGSCL